MYIWLTIQIMWNSIQMSLSVFSTTYSHRKL